MFHNYLSSQKEITKPRLCYMHLDLFALMIVHLYLAFGTATKDQFMHYMQFNFAGDFLFCFVLF